MPFIEDDTKHTSPSASVYATAWESLRQQAVQVFRLVRQFRETERRPLDASQSTAGAPQRPAEALQHPDEASKLGSEASRRLAEALNPIADASQRPADAPHRPDGVSPTFDVASQRPADGDEGEEGEADEPPPVEKFKKTSLPAQQKFAETQQLYGEWLNAWERGLLRRPKQRKDPSRPRRPKNVVDNYYPPYYSLEQRKRFVKWFVERKRVVEPEGDDFGPACAVKTTIIEPLLSVIAKRNRADGTGKPSRRVHFNFNVDCRENDGTTCHEDLAPPEAGENRSINGSTGMTQADLRNFLVRMKQMRTDEESRCREPILDTQASPNDAARPPENCRTSPEPVNKLQTPECERSWKGWTMHGEYEDYLKSVARGESSSSHPDTLEFDGIPLTYEEFLLDEADILLLDVQSRLDGQQSQKELTPFDEHEADRAAALVQNIRSRIDEASSQDLFEAYDDYQAALGSVPSNQRISSRLGVLTSNQDPTDGDAEPNEVLASERDTSSPPVEHSVDVGDVSIKDEHDRLKHAPVKIRASQSIVDDASDTIKTTDSVAQLFGSFDHRQQNTKVHVESAPNAGKNCNIAQISGRDDQERNGAANDRVMSDQQYITRDKELGSVKEADPNMQGRHGCEDIWDERWAELSDENANDRDMQDMAHLPSNFVSPPPESEEIAIWEHQAGWHETLQNGSCSLGRDEMVQRTESCSQNEVVHTRYPATRALFHHGPQLSTTSRKRKCDEIELTWTTDIAHSPVQACKEPMAKRRKLKDAEEKTFLRAFHSKVDPAISALPITKTHNATDASNQGGIIQVPSSIGSMQTQKRKRADNAHDEPHTDKKAKIMQSSSMLELFKSEDCCNTETAGTAADSGLGKVYDQPVLARKPGVDGENTEETKADKDVAPPPRSSLGKRSWGDDDEQSISMQPERKRQRISARVGQIGCSAFAAKEPLLGKADVKSRVTNVEEVTRYPPKARARVLDP